MFKRFCISVLTAILLSFSSVGQVEQIKSIGDEAYVAGLLDTAVIQYESILDQEYVSAEVQYNLGNAYFRVGNIPQAILNYERALKLAPSDEDIQFNLRLAKLRTVDKIEAVPELWFVTRWNSFYQVLDGSDGLLSYRVHHVLCSCLKPIPKEVWFLRVHRFWGHVFVECLLSTKRLQPLGQ
jgi:tetratricopeptide (TPR) repeat protein